MRRRVERVDRGHPEVAHYQDLPDRSLLSDGLFIGESPLVVERMLEDPPSVVSVLVADKRLEWARDVVPETVPLLVARNEDLAAIAGFHVHRGVLALGRRPPEAAISVDALLQRLGRAREGKVTVLAIEDVNNADNMGLLLRSAAAFGVDEVVLSPRAHDPLYRRSIRVSAGYAIGASWARSADWPKDLARLRDAAGLTLVAAEDRPGATDIRAVPPPRRLGLIVGAEFAGLSDGVCRLADQLVRIPMAPGVESLNVAVAAAVCLHRLGRP